MKRLSLGLTLVAVLLVGACVYDFVPPVPEGEELLVVNGDILIGEETTVLLTYTSRVGDALAGNQVAEAVYVESSDGNKYAGTPVNAVYTIDTREADPKAEYRLVIEMRGRRYASTWSPVLPAAAIDSISYSVDRDKRTVTVDVSAHGDSEHRYYRWIARQVWEYHAASRVVSYFYPAGETYEGKVMVRDTFVSRKYDEVDNYYCWKYADVSSLMLFNTSDLEENRLVRHGLFTMGQYDSRTQFLYSVQIIQEAVTEAAWRYYESVRRNSTDVGGLFSPQPSEVRGNVYNLDDPGERVLGYINVTRPAVQRRFIGMEGLGIHRVSDWDRPSAVSVGKEWRIHYWRQGYQYSHTEVDVEFWMPKQCYDCRVHGGNKNKPDWWPNDHR